MWTRRDSVRFALAAAAAFGLTVSLFWTSPSHAVDAAPQAQEIATPAYHDGNCEITASIAASDNILGIKNGVTFLQPGQAPTLQVIVKNTGQEAATTHFVVALDQMTARDMFARTIRARPPAWSQDFELSLGPGESKTIEVGKKDLSLEKMDSITLYVGEPASQQAMLTNANVITAQATPQGGATNLNTKNVIMTANNGEIQNNVVQVGNGFNLTPALKNRVNLATLSVSPIPPDAPVRQTATR